MSEKLQKDTFAIVSMGCVFPNAFNIKHYWETLINGKTSFMPAPKELWDGSQFYSSERRIPDKYYDDVVSYPHNFKMPYDQFKCPSDLLEGLHRRDQYTYTALNECFQNISSNGQRAKVFVGHTNMADLLNNSLMGREFFRELSQAYPELSRKDLIKAIGKALDNVSFEDDLSDQMTHRKMLKAVETVMGQKFPVQMVDAACASSLYTVELGILELLNDEIDMAICGGISYSDPLGKVLFCRLGGSSRFGVFPFQSRADGTVFGEGAGFVAVKRLEKALADKDEIHAIIRGVGTASDGKGKAIYAPNVAGQVLAMQRAYKNAEIDPDSVQWIEAHGTGTPAGDSTEFNSIRKFLEPYEKGRESVNLSSVKGLFGHLGWTAGVASIIKMTLALKNKTLLAQHNFESPNPLVELDKSPLYINRRNKDWTVASGTPRRVGINGFGFGGTNAHVILEEYTPAIKPPKPQPQKQNERVAIVGVGAFFPEAQSWEELQQKISTQMPLTKKFSNEFKPDNIKFRIIDRSASVIDSTQILLLEATKQAVAPMEEFKKELSEETGVFVAQVACLKKQIGHMRRIYADALTNALLSNPMLAAERGLADFLEKNKQKVCEEYPVPNEDSNPGIMPNVMAGRICNYFNFRGPNISLNSGHGSFTQSLASALSNLRHGRCRVAVVASASANTGGAFDQLWEDWSGKRSEDMLEGAVAFTLAKESDVDQYNMKPLAWLDLEKEEQTTQSQDILSQDSAIGYLFSAAESDRYLTSLYKIGQGESVEPMYSTSETGEKWKISLASPHQGKITESHPLDIKKEKWLDQHLIKGKAALPGTFMLETVAQAAVKNYPDFKPIEIKNAQFKNFIRPPVELKVEGQLKEKDANSCEIAFKILSDKYSPKGVLLVKDRLHFSCTLRMVRQSLQMPRPIQRETNENSYKPLHDPYHDKESEVYLSGVFKTISQMQGDSETRRGPFDLKPELLPKSFENNILAPLCLDGALRLASVETGNQAVTRVPVSIESIKIFSCQNDHSILQKEKPEAFYQMASNKIQISQNFQVLYEIRGLKGQTLGEPRQITKKPDNRSTKHVFITGATGFLGSHILEEILKDPKVEVTCLVRGSRSEMAHKRMMASLKSSGLWQDNWDARIKTIAGDLSKPQFGLEDSTFRQLAQEVDQIFHSGARIAWSAPYEELAGVNVESCNQIVALSKAGGNVPISYISTIGVFYSDHSSLLDTYTEEDDPRKVTGAPGGYIQTKWAGEKIMLDAKDQGCPIKIFRPGLLCGSPSSGYWNHDYFLLRLIQYFTQTGSAFRYYNYMDITPVDFASRAIVALTDSTNKDQDIFHIQNTTPRSYTEIAEMLQSFGWSIDIKDSLTWEQEIINFLKENDQSPMQRFSVMFDGNGDKSQFQRYLRLPRILSNKTETLLAEMGIQCPLFDEKLLWPYVKHMITEGLIDPPKEKDHSNMPTIKPLPKQRVDRLVQRPVRLDPKTRGTKKDNIARMVVYSTQQEKDFTDKKWYNSAISYEEILETLPETQFQDIQEMVFLIDMEEVQTQEFDMGNLLKVCHRFGQIMHNNPHVNPIVHVANCYQGNQLHPLVGIVRGFFRALHREIPQPVVRIFSDVNGKKMSKQRLDQILYRFDHTEVSFNGEQAFIYDLLPQEAEVSRSDASHFSKDAVVLFTGGGRGIGGFLNTELAKTLPSWKFAIMARQPRGEVLKIKEELTGLYGDFNKEIYIRHSMKNGPKRTLPETVKDYQKLENQLELENNLKKLDKLGVEYLYLSCDVTDSTKVKKSVQRAENELGPIELVVHCAGLDSSKKLKSKPWEEFKRNIDIKIKGFYNLLGSINMASVKQWINFGSHVSHFGNEGQTDYCAANDGLNTMSLFFNEHFPKTHFQALNWPAWAEIGMAVRHETIKARAQEQGWHMIQPEDAALCFLHEVIHGNSQEADVFYMKDEDRYIFGSPQPLKKGS